MSRVRGPAPLYFSGPAAGRRIALTFDDGPAESTPDLLDVLASNRVRASFFVIGSAIEKHEAVLRRLVAEGHEVGNHLYSHKNSHQLSDEEICWEIRKTAQLIEQIGYRGPTLVRPPYGANAERVSRLAKRMGYGPTVLWTINPRDWCSHTDEIIATVLDEAHPGGIVLLHDGRADGSPGNPTRRHTVLAVGKLLIELRAQGYSFASASEVLQ
jgi:peptidoglycan/xylan/chitin deacetylase (PgdA/CDA1 family)